MIKELTGGNRRVVAFLKVEEHSALLAHMNEGGMAKHYAKYKHKKVERNEYYIAFWRQWKTFMASF